MNIQYPILAIDYGAKRIGLAISDSKGLIASPLTVLNVTKNMGIDRIIEEIKSIIEEYRIKTILIGRPQAFQSTYTKSLKKIDSFTQKIKDDIKIPVIFYDESYSTIQAQNMLLSLGQNTKSTKSKIDMISATVFLQEFLNSKQNKNEKLN